ALPCGGGPFWGGGFLRRGGAFRGGGPLRRGLHAQPPPRGRCQAGIGHKCEAQTCPKPTSPAQTLFLLSPRPGAVVPLHSLGLSTSCRAPFHPVGIRSFLTELPASGTVELGTYQTSPGSKVGSQGGTRPAG